MNPGGDPRIVRFGALEYRYVDGHLEWQVSGGSWYVDPHSPAQFAAVAELVNHPTVREVAAA